MARFAGDPGGLHQGEIAAVVRSVPGAIPLLRDTLYSIAAQRYDAVRVLIVLDSADEAHHAAVEELRAHLEGLVEASTVVVVEPPHTAARSFNTALAVSRSEFCALLTEGDVLYPRHARLLADALGADPQAAVAYGGGFRTRGRATPDGFLTDERERWQAEPFDRARIFRESYIPLTASLIRLDVVREHGIRFDEQLSDLEDWAFLRDLARHRPFVSVDPPVCEHRTAERDPQTWPVDRRDRDDATYQAVIARDHAHPVAISTAEMAQLFETHRTAFVAQERRARTESARAHALEARAVEAERRHATLYASPVLRLYRLTRRTGLHIPFRAAYRYLRVVRGKR